jgi:phosphatidylserine decarboxylase
LNTKDFRHKFHHIPIAREGIPYLLAAAFTTLITAVLGIALLALPLLILTLLMVHFFRDPERIITVEEQDVVSPAEGNVIAIQKVDSTHFAQEPCLKISIFMSVFDVHVNRIPFSGTVQGIHYQKGRFLAANLARASKENEQNWVWIRTDAGTDIVMTQVAGLIARRIVCWPTVGDRVVRGERYGMIRFGSRVDVYVPENSEVLVSQGDHVYGGETVLCRLR